MAKNIKRALVIGAGGFIGHNLVNWLKGEGWFVVGIDLKAPPFENTRADSFVIDDIRRLAPVLDYSQYDRIYQLAAQMGGAGYIFTGKNDIDVLSDSVEINLELLKELKDYRGTIFYSSSVCVYPEGVLGKEADAYPANPPFIYGWEKLTSEQLYQLYAEKYGLNVKIARFHNTFGPHGTFDGERAKAPAALCYKVIKAQDGDKIEVWGNGKQIRPFIFIEDLLIGIEALVTSKFMGPVNLGPDDDQTISIGDFVDRIIGISGKSIGIKYINGPTGEWIRHADNELAKSKLKWQPQISLDEALAITYSWIQNQILKSQ